MNFAGQHLEKRGFPHAIRSHESHAVAAQHPQVKILHDGLVAVDFRDALGLDHPLARLLTRVELELCGALPADLAAAFFAQCRQCAHPALIAFAPRRDTLNRPFRFGLDLAIQLVAGLVFLGPDGFAPFFKAVKPSLAPLDLATVDPQGRPGQRAQEGAVVADQHKSGAGALQFFFKPFNRLDIEMVGRLVQQHQFRRFGHQLGQGGTATLPARCRGDKRFRIELQPFGHHGDLVFLALGQHGGGVIAQGFKPRQIGVLLHIADMHTGRHHAQALVGFDQPGHHLHQGGFTRAVAANQRHPVTGLDDKIKLVKNGIAAESQRDARKLEKGCACHAAC